MEKVIKGKAERADDSKVGARLARFTLRHRELGIVKIMTELEKAKASPETIIKEVAKIVDKSSVVSDELKKLVDDKKDLSPSEYAVLLEFVEERAKELVASGHYGFELPYVLSDEIKGVVERNRDARSRIEKLIEENQENPDLADSLKKIEDDLLKNGVKKWEVSELLLGELLLADLSLCHPTLGLDGYFEERKRALGISKESLERVRTGAVLLIEKNVSAEKRINEMVGQSRVLTERVNNAKQRLKEEGYKPYEILPEIARKLDSMPSNGQLSLFDEL